MGEDWCGVYASSAVIHGKAEKGGVQTEQIMQRQETI